MNFKVKLRCIPLFKLLYKYLLNRGHVIAIQIKKPIRRKNIVLSNALFNSKNANKSKILRKLLLICCFNIAK